MPTAAPLYKRKHPRVQPKPGEPIKVNINGENFIDIIHALDISEGGVGLNVAHQFKGCELKQQVSIIIDLPVDNKKHCLQLYGRILHVSGQRFGVSFSNVSADNKHKLQRYIAKRMKEDSWLDWFKHGVLALFRPAF